MDWKEDAVGVVNQGTGTGGVSEVLAGVLDGAGIAAPHPQAAGAVGAPAFAKEYYENRRTGR